MNDILDEIWLENTLRSYMIVASVIVLMLLVKKYIAQSVAHLIFQFVKRVWKDVDKRTFTSLVTKPLGMFLVIFVSLATLHKLKFPSVINADIFNITLKQLLHALGSMVLIISFFRLLLKMIDFIAIILHIRADRLNDTTDNQLIVFFKDFFKVLLSIVGLLMILKFVFGFKIGNVLTGLSIVGAAVALALRESLENLIASFIIFFDKPFSMGDVVKVHNFTGTIEKIGLRSTRIRTDQKTYITVPNKQMVDSITDNLSLRTQRKVEMRLEIGLTTSSAQLDQFINGVRKILDQPEVETSTVILSDITPSAFLIVIDYFTGPITQQDFNTVKEQNNFAVLRLMEQMNLEISGAVTDIKIVTEAETISQR
ncbi:mechanosensitive ion channel family protein [Terrimonas sp. NA20]|uniref:Mechanosensitive ion channel family protein n=1 Tax=Terrimonas ginsenosidimutans TaxID=2908004 RepID=A0ABS9KQ51_9BACT|nr:mechanosensitive ion channel domain-containing protein [Terrimonas ginsenosidimutans]MCG2614453.1 mechanosensitive ion channel family protein [Terrimonas ginsenosidimutans]